MPFTIRLDIAVAVITLIFMHTLHYQIIYREASTIVIFACIMAYQAALIFTLNFTSPEIFASNAELGTLETMATGHCTIVLTRAENVLIISAATAAVYVQICRS